MVNHPTGWGRWVGDGLRECPGDGNSLVGAGVGAVGRGLVGVLGVRGRVGDFGVTWVTSRRPAPGAPHLVLPACRRPRVSRLASRVALGTARCPRGVSCRLPPAAPLARPASCPAPRPARLAPCPVPNAPRCLVPSAPSVAPPPWSPIPSLASHVGGSPRQRPEARLPDRRIPEARSPAPRTRRPEPGAPNPAPRTRRPEARSCGTPSPCRPAPRIPAPRIPEAQSVRAPTPASGGLCSARTPRCGRTGSPGRSVAGVVVSNSPLPVWSIVSPKVAGRGTVGKDVVGVAGCRRERWAALFEVRGIASRTGLVCRRRLRYLLPNEQDP
ncbi:hypothetical protein ABIA38_002938 [Embleya sp. AB8]